MAITLDTIADKVFSEIGGGYSKDEVDGFLDEIMDEMERREAETRALREQGAEKDRRIEELTEKLESAAAEKPAPQPETGKHSAESFELVLSKAKSVYEEIVGDADRKADEIVGKANEDAASIRSKAEESVRDLTAQFEEAKSKTQGYYDALRRLMDEQGTVMESLRKLLG